MKTIRAKVYVTDVVVRPHVNNQETVTFNAVAGTFGPNGESEDNTYARWTPSGEIKLGITNPDLYGKFKPGQKFYVDFTEADIIPTSTETK